MMLFIQYGTKPFIHLVTTMWPEEWLDTATGDAKKLEAIPYCIGRHPGGSEAMADFLRRFLEQKNPDNGGYPDTPELRAWIAAAPEARVGASGVGRPVTFGDDIAVEIWKRAWTGEESDPAIARQYGITAAMVSLIARGDTRKHLFKLRVEDGWVYVRLAAGGDDGPEYRFRNGGRRK